jgi:hypothetical protein
MSPPALSAMIRLIVNCGIDNPDDLAREFEDQVTISIWQQLELTIRERVRLWRDSPDSSPQSHPPIVVPPPLPSTANSIGQTRFSKAEFIRYFTDKGMMQQPSLAEQINSQWDVASKAAQEIELTMPSIGFLSERKRIDCFLSVCQNLDQLLDSKRLTFDSAMLTVMILQFANSSFCKAYSLFMSRASSIPLSDAVDFPRMALEFYKAARGR